MRSSRFVVAFFVVGVGGGTVLAKDKPKPLTTLQKARKVIPFVETNNNVSAVGDKYDKKGKLKPESEWSQGSHQIGPKVVKEYNDSDTEEREYKTKDMKGNFALSDRVCDWYLRYWCNPKRLGREPTLNDYLMTWRWGPSGPWQKPEQIDRDRLAKGNKFLAEEEQKEKNAKK